VSWSVDQEMSYVSSVAALSLMCDRGTTSHNESEKTTYNLVGGSNAITNRMFPDFRCE